MKRKRRKVRMNFFILTVTRLIQWGIFRNWYDWYNEEFFAIDTIDTMEKFSNFSNWKFLLTAFWLLLTEWERIELRVKLLYLNVSSDLQFQGECINMWTRCKQTVYFLLSFCPFSFFFFDFFFFFLFLSLGRLSAKISQ